MTRAEVRAIGIQPIVISEEQHSSDGPAKVTRDEEWHYVGLGLEVYFSGESELRVEFVSCTWRAQRSMATGHRHWGR
jgi:hypothetical protein